jgi:hypothetical protein
VQVLGPLRILSNRAINSLAHCSRGAATMPAAILITGLRSFSSRAHLRHCGLSSRKSSAGSSFLHPAHCRQPTIAMAFQSPTAGVAQALRACRRGNSVVRYDALMAAREPRVPRYARASAPFVVLAPRGCAVYSSKPRGCARLRGVGLGEVVAGRSCPRYVLTSKIGLRRGAKRSADKPHGAKSTGIATASRHDVLRTDGVVH